MLSDFLSFFANFAEVSQFSEFRLRDLLDILLLSVLIYRITLLIQGTRTMYILYGLLFIIISAVVASEMRLYGVTLVFNSFISSIVIIVVILFQADFRNALARVGTRQFLKGAFTGRKDELVDIFVRAVQQMSEERTGALIVFERTMDTKNLQNGGILMNAVPSVQLLVSIFDKHVSMHDGAVILDRKRLIKTAGAILPLTVNIEKRVEYGTRHRAAIGISEETDAVALVVSEQTGRVSYTKGGQIEVIKPVKDFLERIFIRNRRQKIISLCFGFIIWLIASVSYKKNVSELVLSAPLAYTDPPANLIIKNNLPNSANITLLLRGLANITQSDFLIRIDLSRLKSGSNYIDLRTQTQRLPGNAEILNIDPASITINTEEAVERVVSVRVETEGELKKGFVLEELNISPKTVTVIGPKSLIGTLGYVKTGNITIIDEDADFVRSAVPVLPSYFRLKSEREGNITVFGIVSEISEDRRLNNVPAELFGEQYKATINPNLISVTLSGPASVINQIDVKKLRVYFDAVDYSPGIYKPSADSISLSTVKGIKVKTLHTDVKISVSSQRISISSP
ncbi:hypothetical protein CHS0354_018493 [Potamilus streckersoni]|uniref:DAC domain-containing protein n=1 Tax=Potamilus streckersoni TaxID=2493646 RepID=A0AAE0W9C4_9BIVA|nr:hypothetical protein CHS0354_018493 [Potamilus streckersoni]